MQNAWVYLHKCKLNFKDLDEQQLVLKTAHIDMALKGKATMPHLGGQLALNQAMTNSKGHRHPKGGIDKIKNREESQGDSQGN